MLEAMAGPAANDPDIFRFRVAIQDEVVVCGVLILAHPALKQRGASHRREARAQIGTRRCQFFLRDLALHGGGINDRSTCVISDLEAAPVIPRNAIKEVLAVINPNRHLRFGEAQVACASAEEEHLLTSGSDKRRKKGDDFPKPRTTCKNIRVSV